MADLPTTPIAVPTQALTANQDNPVTLAQRATAGVFVQNNTGATLYVGRDTAAYSGGPIVLAAGQSYSTGIPVSVLHLWPTVAGVNVNSGTPNVYIEASLL